MKTLPLILPLVLVLFLTSFSAGAQTQESAKFVYCELVGTQKFMSTKVTIAVDFGEERNAWKDNRMRDEESGKVKVFNSMVDGLNYMGDNGWEFVQAYVVTYGNQNVYRWLLKRQIGL
jgi:hypothetical protein